MIKRIKKYILMNNKWSYLLVSSIAIGVITRISTLLVYMGVDKNAFTNARVQEFANESFEPLRLITLLLAQVLDTSMFQFGIFLILRYICRKIWGENEKSLYIIPSVVTVLIFASQHYFSIYYILMIIM